MTEGSRNSGEEPGPPPETHAFAHESEAELARILDFYDVRWEYEPHTFPILWNLEGAVVESFSPDFWLPDLDLYLELTTLKQRLVRKKNRKLRRLREVYPGIRIKLFYARDFRALMLKYGKLRLIDGLLGTSGQVVPVRSVPDADPALQTPDLLVATVIPALAAAPALDVDETVETPPPLSSPTRRGAGRRARRRAAQSAQSPQILEPHEAAR